MADLYPLRFEPVFRRYIWGGRRLKTTLGKQLPSGDDYAESWELVDRHDQQSTVAAGPLAGTTLGELVQQRGTELLGRHDPLPRFPLMFKFLDAHRDLSVQVHPDDQAAAQLDPPDLGKTEAWVIIEAEPGSRLYTGLKEGVDRIALRDALANSAAADCLHAVEPRPGDCFFIPAGTVHALGSGLLVAEIQQASDTTYRLYDWDRLGADGKPRPLHIDQALEAIDYHAGPVGPQTPATTDSPHAQRLVAGDKFVLDRWRFDTPQSLGGDDRCHILAILEGRAEVAGDAAGVPLSTGETILLPAAVGKVAISPQEPVVLLDMYLP